MRVISSVLPALFLLSSFTSAASLSRRQHGHRRRQCTATPAPPTLPPAQVPPAPSGPPACYPSLEYDPTLTKNPVGKHKPDSWWCPHDKEYGFLGFSYAVEHCPSAEDMHDSFKKMRENHDARYVRIYAACDREKFWPELFQAAFEANIGVYALVWFGFDGDDKWVGRLDKLVDAIEKTPLAPFVVRSLAIGSEALFDNAILADKLASVIGETKQRLSALEGGDAIKVSTSEMPYKLEQNRVVTDAADNLQLNMFPFFAGNAREGGDDIARDNVKGSLKSMRDATNGKKKIVVTQTGWPSNADVWKPNSKDAVVNLDNEKAYFKMLDGMCEEFKEGPMGGYGWFAHMYDDNNLSGWGITVGGKPKFEFKPRTKC